MKIKVSLSIIGCLLGSLMASTSMKVDMNPLIVDIQSEIVVGDTAKPFFVDFIGSGFIELFAYQFSIAFDTSRVTYLGCDKDYGMTGTKNILAGNGGSVSGVCQKQVSPPAWDTVDYGYSIFEDDSSLAVSGVGLMGIAGFKSKLAFGDTATISILKGGWLDYEGTALFAVDTFIAGRYIVLPITAIGQGSNCEHSKSGFTIAAHYGSARSAAPAITYTIAPEHGSNAVICSINLYDVRGRHITTVVNSAVAPGTYSVECEKSSLKKSASGILICTMRAGNFSKTIKIRNGN